MSERVVNQLLTEMDGLEVRAWVWLVWYLGFGIWNHPFVG